jgi:hypothetical protein
MDQFIADFDARLRDLLSSEATRDLSRADGDDAFVWRRYLGSVTIHRHGAQVKVVRQNFVAPPGVRGVWVGSPLTVPIDELGVEQAAQFAAWLEHPTAHP